MNVTIITKFVESIYVIGTTVFIEMNSGTNYSVEWETERTAYAYLESLTKSCDIGRTVILLTKAKKWNKK